MDVWATNPEFLVIASPSLAKGQALRTRLGFPGPYTKYVLATIGVAGLLKLMEGKETLSQLWSGEVVAHLLENPEFCKETLGISWAISWEWAGEIGKPWVRNFGE